MDIVNNVDTAGITPEEFARIWDAQHNCMLVPAREVSDDVIRQTPIFASLSAALSGNFTTEEMILGLARGACDETYEAQKGHRMGASVLPLFEAADAFGLSHDGKLDIYMAPEGAEDDWRAPAGGLYGTDAIAQCFEIYESSTETAHSGHLIAAVAKSAKDGSLIGSLKLPGKRRRGRKAKASGAPRAPRFGWSDYAKLEGYGDDPESAAGKMAKHNGFIKVIVQNVEVLDEDGCAIPELDANGNQLFDKYGKPVFVTEKMENIFEFAVTRNEDDKLVLSLYSHLAEGSAPVVRCIEGKKTGLVVSEDVQEVSAASKMVPASPIGGGRSPVQEFDLKDRIREIEEDNARAKAEPEPEVESSASALLDD